MMRQATIALTKLQNLVMNAISKEMNNSKVKVTEPEWPFFVDEEVEKRWDFVGYDKDAHTYKFQNLQKGLLMNYMPEIGEVTVGKIGFNPNVFFDKEADNWKSFYYEENSHYNEKTRRWEYYDVATGEWTNVVKKKIPESEIAENQDKYVGDDLVVRYEFVDRDTMKSSPFVRYNKEEYKPIYNIETGNFEYCTAEGIAIYMSNEHMWKIDNLKGNVVYFSTLNGRRMSYNEETLQYEIVKTPEEIEEEERAERERIAAEQAEEERKIREAKIAEQKAREQEEAIKRQQEQEKQNLGVLQDVLNRANKAAQEEKTARAEAEARKKEEARRREEERKEQIARAKREVEEAENARKRALEERKRREEENRRKLVDLAVKMGEMARGNSSEQKEQNNKNESDALSEEKRIQEGRQTLAGLAQKMRQGVRDDDLVQKEQKDKNASNTLNTSDTLPEEVKVQESRQELAGLAQKMKEGIKNKDLAQNEEKNVSNNAGVSRLSDEKAKKAAEVTAKEATKVTAKEAVKEVADVKAKETPERSQKVTDQQSGKEKEKEQEKAKEAIKEVADVAKGRSQKATDQQSNEGKDKQQDNDAKEKEILERRLAIRKILEGNSEDKPVLGDNTKYRIIIGAKTIKVDKVKNKKSYNMNAFQKIGLLAAITTWFKQLFSMSTQVYEIGFNGESSKGNNAQKLTITRINENNKTNETETNKEKKVKRERNVAKEKTKKLTLGTDLLEQVKEGTYRLKRTISGPLKNAKRYKGYIKGAVCFVCGAACTLGVNALAKSNNYQDVSQNNNPTEYRIVYGTSFDELHNDSYKYKFISNYDENKQAVEDKFENNDDLWQGEEKVSNNEMNNNQNDNISNTEDHTEAQDIYTITNGHEDKRYLVSAGTSYTGDALGVYPGMQFGQNTYVEIFNRVIVKTDENGNDSIILSSKEQTWEEFARQNGLSMAQVNDMLNQDGAREMVAVQMPGLNHSVFNTYGWIDASKLQSADSLIASTSDQQITSSMVDEIER